MACAYDGVLDFLSLHLVVEQLPPTTQPSSSLALHFHTTLPLVKRNISLDLVHLLQRLRIVPRCVLDFRFVRRDAIVRSIALVRAVCGGGCGAEVRLGNAVGRELVGVRNGNIG
jgi:hypothetical protein